MFRPSVAVCVCTRGRPKMLRSCLASLGKQIVSQRISPVLVVIDNNSTPDALLIVEEFKKTNSPFPIFHVHEPNKGLSNARNKALETALDFSADFIVFIDDDQVADVNWLQALMAPRYMETSILVGKNIYINDCPWTHPISYKMPEGQLLTGASTCGVRFTIELVKQGLRFSDSYNLTGGEDRDFFERATKLGFKIRGTHTAVTRERWTKERLGFWPVMHRYYWQGAEQMGRSRRKAVRTLLAPLNVLSGSTLVVVALPLRILHKPSYYRLVGRGGRKVAKSLGRLASACGIQPQPYATVVGE